MRFATDPCIGSTARTKRRRMSIKVFRAIALIKGAGRFSLLFSIRQSNIMVPRPRNREMIRSILRLSAVALTLLPIAASAHVGVGDTHGFVHGFSHPVSGIDHVLAMVAVGLLAAHLGGRALWLVPMTFVSVIGLAGVAGMAG